MVRSYERWYFATPQRFKRSMERAMYYLENPLMLRKRVGRAVGVIPGPQRLVVTNHH